MVAGRRPILQPSRIWAPPVDDSHDELDFGSLHSHSRLEATDADVVDFSLKVGAQLSSQLIQRQSTTSTVEPTGLR